MKCNGDNLLVVMDEDQRTDSGIIMAGLASTGTIFCDCDYKDLKAGTPVIVKPTAGVDIMYNGKKLRQCTAKELIAILDENEYSSHTSESASEDDLK